MLDSALICFMSDCLTELESMAASGRRVVT